MNFVWLLINNGKTNEDEKLGYFPMEALMGIWRALNIYVDENIEGLGGQGGGSNVDVDGFSNHRETPLSS
ncbi:hypothetical protein GBA52_013675 [Prunus armeniaca]|nr:hypothetical protein GBA52_013675 [Prunus armeniaca]